MKMGHTSKKHETDIRNGTIIKGKWHGKQYLIKERLGQGAIGSVYLCESNGKKAALKVSDKGASITMEVNVLKTLQKVQGNKSLGPSLLDVDDWIHPNGHRYSFYVMDYLKGKPLAEFIQIHGEEWLGIFMLQLLEDLGNLHQAGWVFGDLKTDNLIVTYPPPRLKWIDVGGTTQIGRSIKEYTEFYDRGYWNMGSRKAEPSYDLFALGMVILRIYHPKGFNKGTSPQQTLLLKLSQTHSLKKYKPCLEKALTGRYVSSAEMRKDLSALLLKHSKTPDSLTRKVYQQKMSVKDDKKHTGLEGVAFIPVMLFFYCLYLLVTGV